jgi:hypothetical protein
MPDLVSTRYRSVPYSKFNFWDYFMSIFRFDTCDWMSERKIPRITFTKSRRADEF